jgi:hypothetical protein
MTDPKYRWSILKSDGQEPYHPEWVQVWTWYRTHWEFDSFDVIYHNHVVFKAGCVCHTPGPIDWFYRQPRLMRYCTAKDCQEWAKYAIFPHLHHDLRPTQYACQDHLEKLDASFQGMPIWADQRTDLNDLPRWEMMYIANGPLTVEA